MEDKKDNKPKSIGITEDNSIHEQMTQSNTSANILCNYMRKYEFLTNVLRNLALKPRYFEERLEYLGIPGIQAITFPMLCFCDIPLSKVGVHMENYGHYGIALKKQFCIKKDVQPVMYLNHYSRLKGDISAAFRSLVSNSHEIDEEFAFLPDALLSYILFTKPIYGYMRRGDENPVLMNFKDECEWRYIPQLPTDMPLALAEKDNTDKGRTTFSNVLAKDSSTWFRFGIDDIEYIIVPNEEEALRLIRYISRMRKCKLADKHKLISKIEIAEAFNKNLT